MIHVLFFYAYIFTLICVLYIVSLLRAPYDGLVVTLTQKVFLVELSCTTQDSDG